MTKLNLIMMAVTYDMVQNGDLADYETVLTNPDFFGRVCFSFDGYDNDPRELYEIPEVVAWVDKLYEKVPQLLYFMSDLIPANLTMMVLLLCARETNVTTLPEGRQHVSTEVLRRIVNDMLDKGVYYATIQPQAYNKIQDMRTKLRNAVGL